MADVVPGELVDGLLDLGEAALLPHLQRGEVGVRAGTVPVALQDISSITACCTFQSSW